MRRRTFLTSTVSAGISGSLGASQALAEEWKGRPRSAIPTPALLLDLDAFDGNLRVMAEQCKKTGCGFRPHAKTHKCPEIARRQVAAGALGVCVATVPEAEAMVAAGIRGVLLTSPIMESGKIARMVALAGKEGTVLLALGHARQVERLQDAAAAAKATVDVLVDLDVGDRRTGILPGKPALELARRIQKGKNLRLRGLQAYAGHASHTVGFERRRKVSRQALQPALETRELFAQNKLPAAILSCGSTGTYNIDSELKGVTELQVGSFIFMDVDYRRIGGKSGDVYTDFQPSLTVLTTVVSTTHPDRVSIDAGTKALDTTVPHRGQAKGKPHLSYSPFGDEFGSVTSTKEGKLPAIGERLEFIVPHCDPSANLYDRIYAMRGDRVEGIWPLAARREFHGGT